MKQQEHNAYAVKKRRTLLQYDAFGFSQMTELNFTDEKLSEATDMFLELTFRQLDELPHQVDTVFWDIMYDGDNATVYPSKLYPRRMDGIFGDWAREGTDIYKKLFEGAIERGYDNMLAYRVSEVDIPRTKGIINNKNKRDHPEQYIHDWDYSGLNNLAVPDMRARMTAQLKELFESYPLRGVEIDFCRITPFLPLGRQWELRGCVTEFLRGVRAMLIEREQETGLPMLLGARVGHTLDACHSDGLDIESWAEEQIVDFLILGSRSYEYDIEGFRNATKSRLKLYPCFDAHHTTDGYAAPSLEIYRGVFSDWWDRGADGVLLFNWPLFKNEAFHNLMGYNYPFEWNMSTWDSAFVLAGDPTALHKNRRTYVVERRYGYPWGNGKLNKNDDKQLPQTLSNDGAIHRFMLHIGDTCTTGYGELNLVLYGALMTDEINISINGYVLSDPLRDDAYSDVEVRTPECEFTSGVNLKKVPVDTERRLTKLTYQFNAAYLIRGFNELEIKLNRRGYYPYVPLFGYNISVERIELTI